MCRYNKGQGPWCSDYSCLLGKSEIAGSNPALAFSKKKVSSPLTRKDSILSGPSVTER